MTKRRRTPLLPEDEQGQNFESPNATLVQHVSDVNMEPPRTLHSASIARCTRGFCAEKILSDGLKPE